MCAPWVACAAWHWFHGNYLAANVPAPAGAAKVDEARVIQFRNLAVAQYAGAGIPLREDRASKYFQSNLPDHGRFIEKLPLAGICVEGSAETHTDLTAGKQSSLLLLRVLRTAKQKLAVRRTALTA